MLILDQIYRDFLLSENTAHNLLQFDWDDVLIQLYSFSKSYCILGHPSLIAEMAKVMNNIQICTPRAARISLAPMIKRVADWREANNQEMAHRGDAFRHAFSQLA